jgi:hypothetical protein
MIKDNIYCFLPLFFESYPRSRKVSRKSRQGIRGLRRLQGNSGWKSEVSDKENLKSLEIEKLIAGKSSE